MQARYYQAFWKKNNDDDHNNNDNDSVIRDGEPLARVPLMARGTIFWARHRSKRSAAIDSSVKEFSVGFSQFNELSEMLKFIMYPDKTLFDKLNLSPFDWLEIEEFEISLIDF
ncbi:uncharacterized protein TNCV_2649381 [Trichonephila clavipes]|nr:uncharacterized protein TNCV_2649381 [Trichonephila clavipes]